MVKTRFNTTSIIAITTLVLIVGGLAIVLALDNNQSHASIFKDSSTKVKNLVKNVIGKIFHRGGSGGGGG
jgi:hypothetical protein